MKMISLEQLQQDIEKNLIELGFDNMHPRGLYEPVSYILSIGGKRIRPVMLLMACNLFSDEITHAMKPALGIEVFHNFTLLHDDIMDAAPLRRNSPTVHVKWNPNTAILSGDAMSVLAFQYIMDTKPELALKIFPVFCSVAIGVCEGQQYDVDFETSDEVSQEDYLNMIRLKTSVLLAAAFQMGAILGGADDRNAQMMYETGLNLGLAFQIQDDYLDSFGEQEKFGKSIGGDIVMNKKTLLMIKAMEGARGDDKEFLNSMKGEGVIDPKEKIRRTLDIFTRTGAKDLAIQKIREYSEKAIETLGEISVPEERKTEVRRLISLLMGRRF
jgi:geranylgeranyl diphosphate synthase, type II